MKKISIVVPTYNEEKNVVPLSEEIISEFNEKLPQYDYEIIFIDNDSQDETRNKLREICGNNYRIKAIFNAKNFGPFNSPYYGLLQATGDCAILLCADFQDPIEMVHQFVREWENGYKIVIGQKTSSKENKIMYFLRSCYYKLIKRCSSVEQIEHFTGFGLYDHDFLKILSGLKDPTPFLRGLVAELGYNIKIIPYQQQKRRTGKSYYRFYSLYDAAMLSFTSYTKIGLRLATFVGIFCASLSILVSIIYLVLKLLYWDRFTAGMAPVLIGMFLLGAIQLIFIGLMGEYILSINTRLMNRPLVIEEERINFPEKSMDFD